MASCLGISTENNLIKYAKVSKEHDNFRVDSFGVKFFDKLEDAIKQIVEETQSENTPININLTNEMYHKFEVFNGLKKKDVDSILASEFELLCEDENLNYQTLVSKYILSETPLDKEKNTALYVTANKGDIAGKLQKLENYKINNLIPVPIALFNLLPAKKENTAIINIEDKTTITTVVNGQITNVAVLEIGMKQILNKISKKENSYARAYEACKNTTIFTMDVAESQMTENEYLEDIMPVLFDIVKEVKDILDMSFISMQKIYLTGTGTVINNIDLYFQEYFTAAKCEILTPSFGTQKKENINIKEYVEVNSAIALAKQGLGEGIQETNFKNLYAKNSLISEIKRIANKDIEIGKGKTSTGGGSKGFKLSLDGTLDRIEKDMIRVSAILLFFIVILSVISIVLTTALNSKIEEADGVIEETKTVIATIEADTMSAKEKTSEYSDRIKKLEDLNNEIKTDYKLKRAIPNLLNKIMAVIPKEVQLTSIENVDENKIIIKAEAERYEELGYFGAVLKNEGILLNVTTSSGNRENSNAKVKIDIEGNLP